MEKLLKKIYASRTATFALKLIGDFCSAVIAAVYLAEVILSFLFSEYTLAVGILVSAAVGLVLVSVVRIFIGAPRPYELYGFYEIKPRKRSGRSFPSRHAYSSFAIATLAALIHPLVALGTALVALSLCISRVLVGIHFIKDVVAGALIGIIAGVLGILIIIL